MADQKDKHEEPAKELADEPTAAHDADALPESEEEQTNGDAEQAQVDSSAGKVLPPAPSHKRGRTKRLADWFSMHKKLSMLLSIVLVLAVLGGVPWTRYKLVGLVWKQQYRVVVLDSQTHNPVSSANFQLAGHHAITNNKGEATFKLGPGPAALQVSKKYYASTSTKVVVPILKQKNAYQVQLQASGRQVPVVVRNKLSGKPIANALVKAAGTEVKTDANGQATIVLPASKQTISASLSASGFNDATSTVEVTSQTVKANVFDMTPAGKVYFLSNLSGKIDVVKTNLDGSSRQTVLAGTGFERSSDTSLLASRDWKYLVLKAVRDTSGNQKLLIINTANDKVTTFDEGANATFNLVGWYNHVFLYQVTRGNLQPWESGLFAVKSYNADSGQLVVLDQSQAEGNQNSYTRQTFANFYIVPGQLVYSVAWGPAEYSPLMMNKTSSIRAISLSNQNKKDYKTFDATSVSYIDARVYEPTSVIFAVHPFNTGDTTYYEFESSAVKPAANVNAETFNQAYPTYLVSPSGDHTFWSDARDGKNTLFVGDQKAKNSKQLASLSDYQSYGWYSDNYVLLSKKGSELYIMSASGGSALKITDYYKPAANYSGYGYGYGGL